MALNIPISPQGTLSNSNLAHHLAATESNGVIVISDPYLLPQPGKL